MALEQIALDWKRLRFQERVKMLANASWSASIMIKALRLAAFILCHVSLEF